MSPFFSLIPLSLLLLSTLTSASTDDPLIRQVVSNKPTLDNDLSRDPHHHFTLFKKQFKRSYVSQDEHEYRFKVFQANLRQAQINQALDPTAVHGVTQFSDLTPDEFREKYLGMKLKYPAHANQAPMLPTDNLPLDFDWREKGAVTPVKNQGGCGSCWSFSTTGALEGANFLATGKLESLSEQQLLDCDRECDPNGDPDDCDNGCNGGLMNNAFEYLVKAGGLMREEDYPYAARNGACKFDKSNIAARVANYSVVPAKDDQIAANLVNYGPLTVGINAKYMSSYIGGVSCPYKCSGSYHSLDHGVLLVGYGSAGYAPARGTQESYWIIKNSWGSSWGEDGYYKICRSYNSCGVNTLSFFQKTFPSYGRQFKVILIQTFPKVNTFPLQISCSRLEILSDISKLLSR